MMKTLSIPTALALAALLSGAPVPAASASQISPTGHLIRGIPPMPYRPIIRGIVYHPKHPIYGIVYHPKYPIYGIVLHPKYPIRGLVVDRPMGGGMLGPQVRGVPVERGL